MSLLKTRLLKIRLFTFQTSHNELDIPLPQFESLSKNWEKYVFDWEELNFEHIAEILTLGKGPLISQFLNGKLTLTFFINPPPPANKTSNLLFNVTLYIKINHPTYWQVWIFTFKEGSFEIRMDYNDVKKYIGVTLKIDRLSHAVFNTAAPLNNNTKLPSNQTCVRFWSIETMN